VAKHAQTPYRQSQPSQINPRKYIDILPPRHGITPLGAKKEKAAKSFHDNELAAFIILTR
jgi:hypothetical protein